jgi:hypothetical protein
MSRHDRGFIMLANETGQPEFKIAKATDRHAPGHRLDQPQFTRSLSDSVRARWRRLMDSSHADIHGGTMRSASDTFVFRCARPYVVSRPAASDETRSWRALSRRSSDPLTRDKNARDVT